ncbi:hypothetical protein QUF74_01835 [Candidatus Halobeggiatoa sp. HSG11]|nr:hypothetical protein [Candidatus Halobeggiatoa sp. HSG11]
MSKEDLEKIETALHEFLFDSSIPEDGFKIALQNPQLLTEFVDDLLKSLIQDADEEDNLELATFYRNRRNFLNMCKQIMSSQKEILLLHVVRQALSKRNISLQTLFSVADDEFSNFQQVLIQVLIWLKNPTIDKGVVVLQQNPELLTDKPIKLLGWMMNEAGGYGSDIFIQILKIIREFLQTIRITLLDKEDASTDDVEVAIRKALKTTDFSILIKKRPTVLLA